MSFFLLLTISSVYSQDNDHFFFQKLSDQTIEFYLNESGDLTIKSKSSYFRRAVIDSNFRFVDRIIDFYSKGDTAFTCEIEDGELDGQANKYYPNGLIEYTGFYKNSSKDSIWKYYFENGQLAKVFEYKNNEPFFIEAYKKNGKTIFKNGNGKYVGTFIPNSKVNMKHRITGNVKNGRMDGKWKWRATRRNGYEYYDNGRFLKAEDDNGFEDNTKIISLTENDIHHGISVFGFIVIPEGQNQGGGGLIESTTNFSDILRYKRNINLNQTLITEIDSLVANNCTNIGLDVFWTIIQFSIRDNSKVDGISYISSNSNISHRIKLFLDDSNDFDSIRINDSSANCYVYLSLFYIDQKLYVPNYTYNYMYSFN